MNVLSIKKLMPILGILLFSMLVFQSCEKDPFNNCTDRDVVSLDTDAKQWLPYENNSSVMFKNDNTQETIEFSVLNELSEQEDNTGECPVYHEMQDCLLSCNTSAGLSYKVKLVSVTSLLFGNSKCSVSYDASTKTVLNKPIFLDINYFENYDFGGQTYAEALVATCNDPAACAPFEMYGFIVARGEGYLQYSDENGDTWSIQ